jgi:hypothetical protein
MKYSPIPTNYMLINAYTNSEWDDCSFALINITTQWLQLLKKRIKTLSVLIKDNSFYHLSYLDYRVDFFSCLPDDFDQTAIQNRDWIYVDLKEDEIEKFIRPENSFEVPEFIITSFNTIHYEAEGKYSKEKFWTEAINIKELVDLVEVLNS